MEMLLEETKPLGNDSSPKEIGECVRDAFYCRPYEPRTRRPIECIPDQSTVETNTLKRGEMIHFQGDAHDFENYYSYKEVKKQIDSLEVEDSVLFFKSIPPLSHLIRLIPQSLPILDLVYSKFAQMQKTECFPSERLRCRELFTQLLWWSAYVDESTPRTSTVKSTVSPHTMRNLKNACDRSRCSLDLTVCEAHIRSLLGVVQRYCPDVLHLALHERAQLADCLESLGCHGLVNCSTGLIRLMDAVNLECGRHVEKIKITSAKLKDVSDIRHSLEISPSQASHQRQMNLRLSNLLARLKQNETLEDIVDQILTNQQLSSLLRIIRKRVQSDRMLLTLFNMLNRAAPSGFVFTDVDPAIPKLMVTFKNAYDKLLRECPSECDSGCGNNQSEDGFSSSDSTDELRQHHSNSSPTSHSPNCKLLTPFKSSFKCENIYEVVCPKRRREGRRPNLEGWGHTNCLLHKGNSAWRCDCIELEGGVHPNVHSKREGEAAAICFRPREKTLKGIAVTHANHIAYHNSVPSNTNPTSYCGTYGVHHHSLHDVSQFDSSTKLGLKPARSLSNLNVIGGRRYMLQRGSFLPDGCSSMESDPEQIIRLRAKVNRLSNELFEAHRQIRLLISSPQARKFALQRPLPEPDYPEAVEYYNQSSPDEIAKTVQRFSDLFTKERIEIMRTLNGLPEFVGSEELQLKTILSVIVLTYRSVHDSVERRREKIFNILGEGPSNKLDEQQLDVALYRYMYRKAKCEHGMANAKEVTSQIWKTLYDFPSLKTCTRFNRFILECVAVVWDLVAGVDGKLPRMVIEYESREFDAERHQRYSNEGSRSLVIKQYLWPALLDVSTGRCLQRGIVIT